MLSIISSQKLPDNQELILFRLQNNSGYYIEVLNYGATLVSVFMPDKIGNSENIILSYDQPEEYLTDTFYLGSTIGRYANRIGNACFELDGQKYELDRNDGKNTNHGGFQGFNKKFFDYKTENDSLLLHLISPDGEGGYPGNFSFSVRYSLNDENILSIEFKAVSDKQTIWNPTNHAYFDLSSGKGNVLDQELKVYADTYLEMNDEFLPTGKVLPSRGTAYDFSEFRKINDLMPLKKEILEGYNAYFISNRSNDMDTVLLASLWNKSSGRTLDVYSDMPGIQLYTGDYLSKPFSPFAGVCLEAQFYPDAPNQCHFPSTLINPGKEVVHRIEYRFKTKN